MGISEVVIIGIGKGGILHVIDSIFFKHRAAAEVPIGNQRYSDVTCSSWLMDAQFHVPYGLDKPVVQEKLPTIPVHYNMFTLNTTDVCDFVKIAQQQILNYLMMNHGGKIVFQVL
jgi:hypothetical protein